MATKVSEVLELLTRDGWYRVKAKGGIGSSSIQPSQAG